MKEISNFRGHTRDVTTMTWHPQHETMLTSGGFDGSILFWLVGDGGEEPQAEVGPGRSTCRQTYYNARTLEKRVLNTCELARIRNSCRS